MPLSSQHLPREVSAESKDRKHDLQSNPVVIVGMACRLPGEVNSPSSLWRMLEEQRSGQCEVPSSRFNLDGFYQANGPDAPGGVNTRGGYFLQENIRAFENDFFGISNGEAVCMDPQQRKLLEVVFECFESAGVTLDRVSGSDTGCYVGNFSYDYGIMQMKDPEYLSRYSATGMGATILANRISHAFNLLGPSLVIDTACSSSLYCLHLACAALETGECNAAIVAGANLIQSVEQHLGMMKAGVLSATSTCHTFSDTADGYARADGIGSLYLKRLSDAVRDRDPIRAVVRGTAVGSNGKTTGISAPSASAQESVIRKAYQKAQLDFDSTAYIECHGTGTPAGDPIEVEALSRVFKRQSENPLLIGSVKTNVGHSEAVSGLSGIIKTVLALEKAHLPPSIGVGRVNPKIKTNEWGVDIITKSIEWPADRSGSAMSGIRRAGVNSFGYGGANGHAILEAPDSWVSAGNFESSKAAALSVATGKSISSQIHGYLLPFSATNGTALEARVSSLCTLELDRLEIADLAYTLGCRRTHFLRRGYIVAQAQTLHNDLTVGNLRTLPLVNPNASPSAIAFVFTGQGAQWPGMGKELFEDFAVFRDSIREMDKVLRELPEPPSWTLEDTLFEPAGTSAIHNATHAQPIATAIQVAIVELLASWDLTPDKVVGHSSGEIAAAFAAGYITSREAVTAAYYRGYLNGRNELDGAMMAVGLGFEDAEAELTSANLRGKVNVACVNSPVSVTMSGDVTEVTALSEDLQSRGIFARKLNTGGKAYHSHHMAPLGPQLERLLPLALSGTSPRDSINTDIDFISSVTGGLKTNDFDATYWRTNMESPVLFSQAVECLIGEGKIHLVEIGPHSALELPLKQIRAKMNIPEEQVPYSSVLSRGKNAAECTLNLLGRLYLHGHNIAFDKINSHVTSRPPHVFPDLAPYPWQYDSILWSEPRASSEFRERAHPHHELLGSLIVGGDGVTWAWRNVLQLKHVKWLESHKLEDTIIFPAAGYLAMAIEAVSQALDSTEGYIDSFCLRHVNILTALVISRETSNQTEVFTTIRPTSLSFATKSKCWWDFEIVSHQHGSASIHATGSISVQNFNRQAELLSLLKGTDFEHTPSKGWYDKLARAGLNFGPEFQSIRGLQIDRQRRQRYARAEAPFLRSRVSSLRGEPLYAIHPITIDAMFQSGIIANAAGSIRKLEGKVPVSIECVIFHTGKAPHTGDMCLIDSMAEVVGFGPIEICSEIRSASGEICAQMQNVRLAPYAPAMHQEVSGGRNPMLRVVWKPDLYASCWTNENFSRQLDIVEFDGAGSPPPIDRRQQIYVHALSLLSHKNPKLRILELSHEVSEVDETLLESARDIHSIKRIQSYTSGYMSNNGELFGAQIEHTDGSGHGSRTVSGISEQTYDVVVLPDVDTSNMYLETMLPNLRKLLSGNGLILAASSASKVRNFDQSGFHTLHKSLDSAEDRVSLANVADTSQTSDLMDGKHILIVEHDHAGHPSDVLASNLVNLLKPPALRIKFNDLTVDTVPNGAIIFSTLEVEQPLLSTLDEEDMGRLKVLTDHASKIVWATGGGFMNGARPDFALVSGLARAIMLEQPSLEFFTFDMEHVDIQSTQTAKNLVAVLHQPRNTLTDYEFIQHDSMVHISRFVPDNHINQAFRQRQGNETAPMRLAEARPSRLMISTPGQFESIYFKQEERDLIGRLEPQSVEIEVQTVGLDTKGLLVLSGKAESKNGSCTLEHCGVVRRVGKDVLELSPGDRVVVMAPGHLKTSEIVPEWACFKLRDDEDFSTICALPVAYSTALYALHHRAQIQPGETILIHSGADAIGIAAIVVAKLAKAEVFTTVATEAQKDMLVSTFNCKRENIYSSRDNSFLKGIMAATDGRGLDIIVNSLTGDLLHDSWRACAPFGRFIELGNKELMDAGRLDMGVFKRNASFSAFDLCSIFYDEHPPNRKLWSKLLLEVMTLYREGMIPATELLEVFDVSQIGKALRKSALENRVGKIVISLEDPNSVLKVQPLKYKVVLDPKKSYIMVGCLGGLGRSISKWMMARGAQNFVFLGRSGADRKTARMLIDELQAAGANARVVRGDVANLHDVQRAVAEVDGKIGGVIQAAMALSEALFTQMSNQSWHTGIDPKLQGCWNLHNAIKGKDDELDFFLMTSSVSGSIGAAAQSNYCSANYFLDVFARHRRSLGLPGNAIGLGMISEVGYLHENPDIEAILSRTGLSALDEDELLQIIDIALSTPPQQPIDTFDEFAESHILTGLEPSGFEALREKGLEGSFPAMHDPRTSLSTAVLDTPEDSGSQSGDDYLPTEVITAIQAGVGLYDAITAHIKSRFSNLLLMPLDKLDVSKALAAFGMDSMDATEFRSWFFHTFKIDIPFFEFLSKTATIGTLSDTVCASARAAQLG